MIRMDKAEITFNDLPKVVAELRDEVHGLKVAMLDLQKGQTQQMKYNRRRTMSAVEAAEYLQMPLNTLYAKLESGEIPATKPGKRWVLYMDELDKMLEVSRKNPVPMTLEEQNAAILASNRRKPCGKN